MAGGIFARSVAACCVAMLVAAAAGRVAGDAAPEAWSCSPARASQVSPSYARKVAAVLDAMEQDLRTHAAAWDLLYRTVGGDDDEVEVMGSAGCIPSRDVRSRADCCACIAAARRQLLRLCPDNARGSVFLRSCTLMFARVERSAGALGSKDDENSGQAALRAAA